MAPEKRRRHRIRRGYMNQPGEGHYADCVPCGHVGGLFASRDKATAQYEEHKRTGKSLRDGAWR
jgi:hypothetical protein